MESIADALGVALPALLEMTDLDKASLDALLDHPRSQSMPAGFVRLSAVLTEYQAFTVQQWDAANRAHLSELAKHVQSDDAK